MWSKVIFGDILLQIAALEDVTKVNKVEFELNPTAQNKAKLHRVHADFTRYLHLEEELGGKNLECNGSKMGA